MSTEVSLNFDIRKIFETLPHRYPFLLVDRVTELNLNQNIKGYKNVSFNEPFFQGHFPGVPLMPGVLIIEAMAQLGGILAIKSANCNPETHLFLFTGLEGVRFRRATMPGDRLEMECTLVRQKLQLWKMAGRATVDGQLVAEGVMTAAITARGDM